MDIGINGNGWQSRIRRRSERQAEKFRRRYQREHRLYHAIREDAQDILHSSNFRRTRQHIQHGTMTVNSHCMAVAKCSLYLSEKLAAFHIRCNRRELIRGALLHDYFLYDWHDKEHVQIHNLHGFYHPGIALKNASAEYRLTPREKDIIKKHMWPLTMVPPMCREAWIVTIADKWCSTLETLRLRRGHGAIANSLMDNRADGLPDTGDAATLDKQENIIETETECGDVI